MGPNPTVPVTSMFPPDANMICQVLPPHIGYQNGIQFGNANEKLSSPSWADFDELAHQPLFELQERLQSFRVVLPEQPPLMKPAQDELIIPLDDQFLDQKISVTASAIVFSFLWFFSSQLILL